MHPRTRFVIAAAALSSVAVRATAHARWEGEPVLRHDMRTGAWRPEHDPLDVERRTVALRRVRGGRRVRVEEVRFTSHEWNGAPVCVFGFYAAPEDAQGKKGAADAAAKCPALLLVHGGGGHATVARVLEAAGRGFAALAIDLPGKGTNREKTSRSTGPDFTVANIYNVAPTPRDSYLFHAIRAEMRAVTFLCAQPGVDARRVGLVGASWGGATGMVTTGLDVRIRCFVNVFGAGYVREGSTWRGHFARMPEGALDTWEANFDASRYAPDIRVPVLGIAATNDGCYWLPQFLKTMRTVGARAPKRPPVDLLCLPNRDHKIDPAAHHAMYRWLESRLMGRALDAAAVASTESVTVAGRIAERKDVKGGLLGREAAISLKMAKGAAPGVRRVEFAYAAVTPGHGHTSRVWGVAPGATGTGDAWGAVIPAPSQLTYVFATVYGRDGSMLSTPVSTVMRCDLPGVGLSALSAPYLTNRPTAVLARHLSRQRVAQVSGTKVSLE